jgi:hypothetical protein
MAYILGLIFSDGNVYKTTLSWQLQMRDKELLFKIRDAMKSDYPIKFSTKKSAVRLRVSNPLLIESLKQFGLTLDGIKFPNIPGEFVRDFIRGFLDGDGWIIANVRKHEICVGFVSHDYGFLGELVKQLNKHVLLTHNNLRTKKRITKKGKTSTIHQIEWYGTNALNIIKFLYNGLKDHDLYLERKYKRQLEARSLYAEIKKGRRWKEVESKCGTSMGKLLSKLHTKKKLTGVQMAKMLGVSSASIYRWLEKTKVRLPIKREVILIKCSICGAQFRKRGVKKYCSLTCAGQAMRSGKMVKCAICGKEIYRPKWWFKRNVDPICSLECCKKWHKLRLETDLRRRCEKTGRFLPNISDHPIQQEGVFDAYAE